jgi:hypothetical protein
MTKAVHTNSIESFWAVLKGGTVGIYNHVSTKYLQLYVKGKGGGSWIY